MNRNPPFHDKRLDADLNKAINTIRHNQDQTILVENSENALRDIVLAGGHVETDFVDKGAPELQSGTYRQLILTLINLASHGIKIHPLCRFWIYNIEDPLNSDFLVAALGDENTPPSITHQTDLLITCCIYDEDHDPDNTHPACHTSPIQVKGIWEKAAIAARAKVVTTFGREHLALSTQHFGNAHFRHLQYTGEAVEQSLYGQHGEYTETIGILIDPAYQASLV